MLAEGTLVDAMMSVRAQIDFLWQFFVSVHIALFALLFIYDHAIEGLNWAARLFMIAGIAGFEWINGNALAKSYMLLDAMLDQYRWAFGQPERFHPAFYDQFVLATFKTRPDMVMLTHSTALLVAMLAMLWRHFIQSRKTPRGMPPMG